MLAIDFVAGLTFEWHIWELTAHSARDFVDQFLLELVLNLIKFDVNCWNWLWPHDSLNSLFWDDHQLMSILLWNR